MQARNKGQNFGRSRKMFHFSVIFHPTIQQNLSLLSFRYGALTTANLRVFPRTEQVSQLLGLRDRYTRKTYVGKCH